MPAPPRREADQAVAALVVDSSIDCDTASAAIAALPDCPMVLCQIDPAQVDAAQSRAWRFAATPSAAFGLAEASAEQGAP